MIIKNDSLGLVDALVRQFIKDLHDKVLVFSPSSLGMNLNPITFDQAVQQAIQASDERNL